MTLKVDVVRADVSHAEQIAQLESKCIADGWSLKAFEEAFENKNAVIFSAVADNKVIGFLNGSFVLDEAELLNIAVSEEYRNCGVAGLLLKAFEKELLMRNVVTIYLEVRESNTAARNLYEKYGFVQNGLRKNYYHNPSENAVLMVKELCEN